MFQRLVGKRREDRPPEYEESERSGDDDESEGWGTVSSGRAPSWHGGTRAPAQRRRFGAGEIVVAERGGAEDDDDETAKTSSELLSVLHSLLANLYAVMPTNVMFGPPGDKPDHERKNGMCSHCKKTMAAIEIGGALPDHRVRVRFACHGKEVPSYIHRDCLVLRIKQGNIACPICLCDVVQVDNEMVQAAIAAERTFRGPDDVLRIEWPGSLPTAEDVIVVALRWAMAGWVCSRSRSTYTRIHAPGAEPARVVGDTHMDALIDDMEYRWSCIQADLRKLPRDAVRVCEYKLDAGEDVDKRAAVADALEFLTGELQALEASTAIAESLDATGIRVVTISIRHGLACRH